MDQNERASYPPNQYDIHNSRLVQTIKSLEEQIDSTIYNYEHILQNQKKTSSDRSEFLLYLIQSLRSRHNEEIEAVTTQLQQVEGEREQAETMQKQMENIGQGLDQIVEESRRLKSTNQSLQKELEEQETRQRQLDQEIKASEKQLEEFRLKVDEWQRIKIKWNRQKKQLLEMIQDAEHQAGEPASHDGNICGQTGEDADNCDHCHNHKIQQLYNKYMPNGNHS